MLMARLLPDVLGQFTGRNERLSNTNIIVWNKYNLEIKIKILRDFDCQPFGH
jgi:hypothetical protein